MSIPGITPLSIPRQSILDDFKPEEHEKAKSIAIKNIHQLDPKMKEFPLTGEFAAKLLTWCYFPEVFQQVIIKYINRMTNREQRDDSEHVEKFKKLTETFYTALQPEDKKLPIDNLAQILYEKYRETYVQKTEESFQAMLTNQLKEHAQGVLAQKIYNSALATIRKEVEDTMDVSAALYPKIHFKEFLAQKPEIF